MTPARDMAGKERPHVERSRADHSGAVHSRRAQARRSSAPLLTVVACAMGAFFVLKIGHIAFNSDPAALTIGTALAQETAEDPAAAEDKQANAPEKATEAENAEDTAKDAGKDMANQDAANTAPTKTEMEVMERLADRRKQLEKRDREVDLREKLLKAAEQKLNKKLVELKQIEARIEASFAREKKESSKEFKDLVSLYENMKPKNAARIFDKLDMDILLSVAQKMNKRKMSAVLAQMNAEVAQRLTVELVARVSGNKTSGPQQLPGVEERNPG